MLHSALIKNTNGSIHNYGIFTKEYIAKGTVLWVLDEPTYTWQEVLSFDAEKRTEFDHYGFQCGVDCYSLPQGVCRETNHSCDPNTWWKGFGTLVARRDIFVDEEVTYDYSSSDIDLEFKMDCSCGAVNCRGVISNSDWRKPEWQDQYGNNLPPHVLAAIKEASHKLRRG